MLFYGFPGGNVLGDYRRISWGKCAWRLEDCLHNSYIAIDFSSYFPFLGPFFSIFCGFWSISTGRLHLDAAFYTFYLLGSILQVTATLDWVFLGFPNFGSGFPSYWVVFSYLLGQVNGAFYRILQIRFPILWVQLFICVMSGVRLSAFFYSLGVDSMHN